MFFMVRYGAPSFNDDLSPFDVKLFGTIAGLSALLVVSYILQPSISKKDHKETLPSQQTYILQPQLSQPQFGVIDLENKFVKINEIDYSVNDFYPFFPDSSNYLSKQYDSDGGNRPIYLVRKI